MSDRWRWTWGLVVVLVAGCGPPDEETDAGTDAGPADVDPAGDAVDGGGARDGTDGRTDGGTQRRRITIRGIDFTETSWSVTGGERVLPVQTEEGDGTEGRTARGTVAEPFERDIVYAWGGIESIEVEGTARVLVDGEIRRNGPKTLEKAPPGDGPPIAMSLHSSVKLLENNGRVSERMVARYAAEAFDDAGYGYEIVYNLMPERPPDEKSNCSAGEAPDWWARQIDLQKVPVVRKDANLLMLNADGGGCGAIAGDHGTTPARNIDEMREWTPVGSDDWHRNMHGTLHEIGHQLGARHDHADDKEGKQHWGAAWIAEDEQGKSWWHRTPNVAGNGAPNGCGDMIEKRQRDTEAGVKRHQLYADCAAGNFLVVDSSEE